MITELFNILSQLLHQGFNFALLAAFTWGILSILLSPCHLSSIPLVVGYISSQGQMRTKRSVGLSSSFALGVLCTIAAIGLITTSAGRMMGDIGTTGNIIIAVLLILIGLYLFDLFQISGLTIPLQKVKLTGLPGAIILGLIFGFGVGPCTFAYLAPILGVVFKISTSNLLKANLLLLAFGIGHVLIIVVAGALTSWVQRYLNWSEKSRATLILKRLCGVLVVLAGIYLILQALHI